MQRAYPVEVRWAPYLLDPSIPPEGRTREPRSRPGDPPSELEQRGERSGITFARGRTHTPNSHLALELAAFAESRDADASALHRSLFSTHFEELGDIGDRETLTRLGTAAGLDAEEVRTTLEDRSYRDAVDERIEWARRIGVTAVPTFVFNDEQGLVGAHEYEVFERVMAQLGVEPLAASDAGSGERS